MRQDVLKPTRKKFDMIGAFNFSFYDFHDRKTLLQYAKATHRSLNKKGTIFLELAGGPDFLVPDQQVKSFPVPKYGRIKKVWNSTTMIPSPT